MMRIEFGGIELTIKSQYSGERIAKLNRILDRLERVSEALAPMAAMDVPEPFHKAKQGESMPKRYEDADAVIESLNTITNTIAGQVATVATKETAQLEELRTLRDQVANGSPVTAEQFDSLVSRAEATLAGLGVIEGNLRPLAADDTNPTPEPEPVPGPGDEV